MNYEKKYLKYKKKYLDIKKIVGGKIINIEYTTYDGKFNNSNFNGFYNGKISINDNPEKIIENKNVEWNDIVFIDDNKISAKYKNNDKNTNFVGKWDNKKFTGLIEDIKIKDTEYEEIKNINTINKFFKFEDLYKKFLNPDNKNEKNLKFEYEGNNNLYKNLFLIVMIGQL